MDDFSQVGPMEYNKTNRQEQAQLGAFARRVLILLVIGALALLLWRIVDALLLAFIGALFAIMFRGLAGLLNRYAKIPMRWALLIVGVLSLALLFLFFWFSGPRINEQFAAFLDTMPTSLEQIEQFLSQYTWGRFLLDHLGTAELNMGQGLGLFARITGVASTVFAAAANLLVVIFAALFFMADPDLYIRGILMLVPESKSSRVAETLDATARTLRYWLLGQAISMFFVGVATAVGLRLAGVPLAFLLGIIAGILEFVPFLGPVAAAVPGILIALTEGWTVALYALLVYVIVQQLESRIVVPLVQWKVIALPPALVILAVVALALLFGLLGVLVATPLTAVAIVWIKKLYVEDVLGKRTDLK
jgi:predicted PurR-regulated permease PerM